MYQCPTCQADAISAMAVFSGKRMPVNCRSCGSASYRKLPLIIEVILTVVLTCAGLTLIFTKGSPILFIAGLAGIFLVIVIAGHFFGKMIPCGNSQS